MSDSLLQFHMGLLFLPCCPQQIGTVAVLCRCFQQRQWKFGCCLQSEQAEAQLAASCGQSLRTWCNLSLQTGLYWKCLGLVSCLESSWNQYIWFCGVPAWCVACLLLWQRCCTCAGGQAEYWSRPSAVPPATKLMVLGGGKKELQHHFCSNKQIHRCLCIR